MTTTGEKVLAALQGHKLKSEGDGKYRCNNPFKIGSDSHGFTVKIHTDGEHGAFKNHVDGEVGSLYVLAERLGIEVPRAEATETKRAFRDLDEYALAHGVDGDVFRRAGWEDCEHDSRPAIQIPTASGARYRFLDGQKPSFKSPSGYKRCWYGLRRAVDMATQHGKPLVLCNGEPSVVVAQSFEIPAAAIAGGAETIPPELLEELRRYWQGDVIIAMDCDNQGQVATRKYLEQLPTAAIVDLGMSTRGDLADFCRLYTDSALDELTRGAVKMEDFRAQQEAADLNSTLKELAAVRRGEKQKSELELCELLNKAQSELDALREKTQPVQVVSFAELVDANHKRLKERMKNPNAVQGIRSHLPMVDRMLGGWIGGRIYTLYGDTNMGKEQPLSAQVKTLTGWKPMGEIKIGDVLASIDDKPSVVTHIFPQGKKRVFEIEFSDGRIVRAGAEHLWEVNKAKWHGEHILTTREIAKLLQYKSNRKRLSIPLPSGDYGHCDPLPVDAWLLGIIIGDGGISDHSVNITSSDPEIIKHIESVLVTGYTLNYIARYCYRISGGRRGGQSNYYIDKLRELGLWGKRAEDKFIPREYLLADKARRIALLQGLLDTDGWVEKFNVIRFCSSSKQLARDVQELVWSLGGICTIASKATKRLPSYQLNIKLPAPIIPFTLKRKAERISPQKPMHLTVTRVTEVEGEDCQCIMVSHPRQLYLTDSYIVTHNSTLAVSIACEFAKRHAGLVVPTETPPAAYLDKFAACYARVSYDKIESGYLSDDEYNRVEDAYAWLEAMNCHVLDAGSPTPQNVSTALYKGMREYGYQWVMIDSVSKMKYPGESDIYNTTRMVADAIQDMARESNLPFLITSQIGRNLKDRAVKMPQINDALGAGTIEQNSDVVLSVYRHEHYVKLGVCDPDPKFPNNTALLTCLKHKWKDAVGQAVSLAFVGGAGFYELAEDSLPK